MKRISIYFLFGISVVTLVTFFDFYFTSRAWTEFYQTDFFAKANRLDGETLTARLVYKGTHDLKDLHDFLHGEVLNQHVSYWLIYENGKIVDTDFKDVPYDVLAERLAIHLDLAANEVFAADDRQNFYAVDRLDAQHQVVIGTYFDTNAFLKNQAETQLKALLLYLLGVLVVCLSTFAFFFRDIMKSVRALGRQRNARGKLVKGFSREAELLARGIAALDQQSAELQHDKDRFRWQVLPSLRSELESGIQPPYDFACTLVRTDINNYTRIFNEFSVPEFAATINEFFTDVTHIAARYGGYVHEFIGDEVICYFKDRETGNSIAIAMAVVRDINQAARKHNAITIKERGYPFTVKSSLAHDRLRFAPLVNGFGLSGPAMVETVRIVSSVTEKEGCVLVCDERHLAASDHVAQFEFNAEVTLKGFSQSKRLFIERGFTEVSEYFDWNNTRGLGRLTYHRSDEDIARTLQWMASTWSSAPLSQVQNLISTLRTFNIVRTSGEPQRELFNWLKTLLDQKTMSDGHLNVLASALRLIENLVPMDETAKPFEELLQRASRLQDRRVVANALDVLKKYQPVERNWAKSFAQHADNRISANAIVYEGLREITPFVVKKLRRMLHAKDPLHVSSAAYAIGEIAYHHKLRDAVYLKTQVGFLRLVTELVALVFDDDSRVRRQAIIAVQKIADPEVIARIEQRLARSSNNEDAQRAFGRAS